MPNWCGNYLTVEGSPEEVAKFKSEAVATHKEEDEGFASPLSFRSLYPMPDDPKFVSDGPLASGRKQNPTIVKKYGADNWYDWSVGHWGTKWDACDAYLNQDDRNLISYSYETAWSPPSEEFWQVVSAKYPTLKFINEYEEGGMDFKGYTEAKAGVVNDFSTDWYPHACERCEFEFQVGDNFTYVEEDGYLCDECLKKPKEE